MSADLRHNVEMRLAEGFLFWRESGIGLPTDVERNLAADTLATLYHGPNAASLAAACQCFFYFRKLHGLIEQYPTWSTLLGDYFFSQFSKNLIPLDSVRLTDAFSEYLKRDVKQQGAVNDYIKFIRGLPAVLS